MLLFKEKIEPITIETDRFKLIRMSADRLAKDTYSWTQDVELMHLLGLKSSGWTPKKWLKTFKALRKENGICWAIYPKGSNQLIGYQTVQLSKHGPGFLTVAIKDRNWWGKRAVLETRWAICDYMFSKRLCPRLYGIPAARNLPSIFNYQSLGFKVEGIMRSHAMDYKQGTLADVVVFGMLREDWINKQSDKLDARPFDSDG